VRFLRSGPRHVDPVDIGSRDPFDAVPVAAEGVEVRADSRSCVQLKRTFVPKPGLAGLLARTFGLRRDIRVDLDERGTAFWKLIDGRRTVRDIEQSIRRTYSLPRHENEKATILFAKMLMERYLIHLEIPRKNEAEVTNSR